MFETISRRSKAPLAQRFAAVGVSVGAYALVIGLALVSRHAGDGDAIPERPEPVLRIIHSGVRPGGGDKLKNPEAKQSVEPVTRKKEKHPQPPRAVPSAPASVPVEPEPIAAAAEPEVNAPASDSPSGTGPLGAGDAGAGVPGTDGPACPEGAICNSIGSEQVLVYSASMSRPLAHCNPPSPLAPNAARQLGLEGRVVAQYVVHADGTADAVNIVNADAPAIYAETVRDWIEHCTFTPSQLNGQPHAVRMVQQFKFASH